MFTRKEAQKMLERSGMETTCDKFTVKKDGTLELMRSYYYRQGRDAEWWGSNAAKQLSSESVELVRCEDRWATWPKTSYFVAVFRKK